MKLSICMIGILFLLFSCSENETNIINDNDKSIPDIGKIHNSGLGYIKEKLTKSLKTNSEEEASITSKTLWDLSAEYIKSVPEYENISFDDVDIETTSSDLDKLRNDFSIANINNKWQTKVNDISNIYPIYIQYLPEKVKLFQNLNKFL